MTLQHITSHLGGAAMGLDLVCEEPRQVFKPSGLLGKLTDVPPFNQLRDVLFGKYPLSCDSVSTRTARHAVEVVLPDHNHHPCAGEAAPTRPRRFDPQVDDYTFPYYSNNLWIIAPKVALDRPPPTIPASPAKITSFPLV